MANATGNEAWRMRTGLAAFLVMCDLRDAHGITPEVADAVCVSFKRQFDNISEIGSLAFGGDQVGAIAREMRRHYRREFDAEEIGRAWELAVAHEHFRRLV